MDVNPSGNEKLTDRLPPLKRTIMEPVVLIDNGQSKLWVVDGFSPDFFEHVKALSLLEEPPIMVGGVQCRQRRNVGFFSDTSIGYRYSGQIMYSKPLSEAPVLQHVLPHVNSSLGTNFNGVLVNSYINGEKYIGAHSDDEKDLDKTGRKMVASISYGATRLFRVRDKLTKKKVLDYPHTSGTLLVMEGEFQKDYTHEIPVQKRIKDERISLTFRHHTQ